MYQSKFVCCNEFLICTIERALHSTYYDDDDDNSADMHEYNFLFVRKSEIYIHLGQTDQTRPDQHKQTSSSFFCFKLFCVQMRKEKQFSNLI